MSKYKPKPGKSIFRYKGYAYALVAVTGAWIVTKEVGGPHLRTCPTMESARQTIDRLVVQDRQRARLPQPIYGCESINPPLDSVQRYFATSEQDDPADVEEGGGDE